VRPLYDDNAANPSAVTRDYVFDIDTAGGAPLLSVFGGKITTYRRLAEHALEKLKPHVPAMKPAWTADAHLPGGDLLNGFNSFESNLEVRYKDLPGPLVHHYARLYGTRAHDLLDGVEQSSDLGQHFGGLLYEKEINYLRDKEWALTAEDILDRRTKHGLHLSQKERDSVRDFIGE
ncbi:MAG: glycerol-3-phosphate dehydrogenase C-terminal domain-containing protein, partial [Hyphomicrobiaceae bacterium]